MQGGIAAVPSARAMRTLVPLLVTLLLTTGFSSGAIQTPQNQPVEITSTGETNYENGLATARDNVAIHIGDTDIYADFAQYNSRTHEVLVEGHGFRVDGVHDNHPDGDLQARLDDPAESVGQETTRAVVKGIFLVIVLDALFSVLFEKLGI